MMDTRIGQCLTDLVRTEGVALAEDPNRVRALLMDTCPDARTEIGLLTVAAEEDIPSRLMRSSDSVFRDGEIARAVVDLQRDRRLDPEASRWTVHQWAH